MAKFRTNHGAKRGRGSGNQFYRSVVLIFIVLGILVVFALLVKKDFFGSQDLDESIDYNIPADSGDALSRYFLPEGGSGQLIHHDHYSISYIEAYEISEWAAYELTRESLVLPNVPRTDWFEEDRKVTTGSANYDDYLGSGYTRGHLVPAGDMNFSQEAMEASFLMSNVAPQKKRFNSGIWNELELNVREWAYRNGRLFVVTGPVLDKKEFTYIGRDNRVAVPDRYYKVVLDADDPDIKAVGFIIPNEMSEQPLSDFMVSVDEVEQVTGLDFFASLISKSLQASVEAKFNPGDWPISDKLYQQRVSKWNKY
jgi:endonuclease G